MRFISGTLILIFSSALHAATFKVFTAVTPPLLEKKGEGVQGFSGVFGKIVLDKLNQAGKADQFEVVWLPWKRALSETQKHKNGVFFPLARTAEREKEYCWLGHLGTAESWFYTTNPKVKLGSLDDLKKYRIGFLNGSMRSVELKKLLGDEAANLEGLTQDLGNYKKLISGRIDIWVTQTEVFAKAEADYKAENKTLPVSYAIRKFLDQDVWIVGNADMSAKHQEMIRAIFRTKKKEPAGEQVSAAGLLSVYRLEQ